MNSRARHRASSGLLYLGLFLVLGAFIASMVDGFPPSWQVLAPVEVAMALLFALNERRTKRWHDDLPNRIRRNDEAAQNAAKARHAEGSSTP